MSSLNAQFILTDTSGTERGLVEKSFQAEVLMAFRQTNLFSSLKEKFINVAFLRGTGSKDFPMLGADPEAESHTPGDLLLGQTQAFTQFNIAIDDFVVGHRFVAGDDQLISHFDAIKPYATSIGQQIGNDVEAKVVRMGILAARTAALSGFHSGGNVVSRVGAGSTIADAYPESATGAANLITDLRTLAKQMDQDHVPEMGRFAVLSPHGRAVLMYDTTGKVFSRDYQDGRNSVLDRRIGRAEGFDLYVSNTIPEGNTSLATNPRGNTTKYDVDCRYVAGNVAAGTGQPIAIAFCGGQQNQAALGMVMAEQFQTEVKYEMDRGGTKMIGRNFLGIGKLCVWCAGEVRGQLS